MTELENYVTQHPYFWFFAGLAFFLILSLAARDRD